jgi:hypothetical protein
MLVGWVQIASTTKVMSAVLPSFTVANQTSGGPSVVDEVQSESVMFPAVSVESVNAPPPVTTNPGARTRQTCSSRARSSRTRAERPPVLTVLDLRPSRPREEQVDLAGRLNRTQELATKD